MTDVIAFGVNENNDLFLDESGNIAIVTNLQAVLQGCEQAVKTLLGELVLQTDLGVPYFEAVFVGTPNLAVFEQSIRQAILSIPGVIQVLTLDTSVTGEVLTYNAVIETEYGEGSINNG